MLVSTFITSNFASVAIITAKYFSTDDHVVGEFGAILALIGVFWTISATLQLIFSPKLSAAINSQAADLIPILKKCVLLGLGFSLPILLFLIIFGHEVLGLFGKEFVVAYFPLIFISSSVVLSVIFSPFLWCSQYSNKIKILTYCEIAAWLLYAVVNIVIDIVSYVLIKDELKILLVIKNIR
jgi:O-antigen/teichoic acid export membrane protein